MTAATSIPPILDDLPTGHDALDFQPYVDALADILLDPATHSPLTLGVFGSWGAGKTSLMRMLADRVQSAVSASGALLHRAVWFNAWKYDKEDALWRALLLVLLDDLERLLQEHPPAAPPKGQPTPAELLDRLREALYRDTTWTEKGKLEANWSQAASAAGGVAFNLLLSGLGLGLAADVLEEARKSFGKGEPVTQVGQLAAAFRRQEQAHYQSQLRSLEQFQRNFGDLVGLLLAPVNGSPRRLVIFIDDLDRCVPEKAIQVLEALKLFLDVPGCLFVLGLDADAIETAIQTRFRGDVKAREYLEKIIQLPFILPPIEDAPMRAYVQSLAPALPDPRCAEIFALGLSSNPRQVKRTINIFLLLSRLVARRPELRDTIKPVRLAKFVAIQHAHPDLYAQLRLRPGHLRDLEDFFRTQETGNRKPGGEGEPPRLPEALQAFAAREPLRRLLCLLDDEDARFDGLTPLELRSYITLTRQAVPIEAPAVHIARLPFEPEMVTVPAGPFLMGTSPDQVQDMLKRFDWAKEFQEGGWFEPEQPQHELTLPAFAIGRYSVTNAEYAAFVDATGHAAPQHWRDGHLPEALADHPVTYVVWKDARAYATWLAERTGQPYRLPTEAEWEKAARGGDGRLWPWGNDWDPAKANTKLGGPGATTPVGQYSPAGDSPYAAADMAGNVWEWCGSLWGIDFTEPRYGYPYRTDDGREGPETAGMRVQRGGSWCDSHPDVVRCASRGWGSPGFRFDYVGFRIARSLLR